MANECKRWKENKLLYRRLVRKMSFEERLWLLETNADYDRYEKRLRFLAKKYAVEVPEKQA